MSWNTTGRLAEISAPTLIIGGSEDPFFSESLLRETAERIPNATLRVYEGVGHGVPKERKRRYESDVLAFLKDQHPDLAGAGGQPVSHRARKMG
jgi:pimeloyl-ACP methyl ester carboxylesterase